MPGQQDARREIVKSYYRMRQTLGYLGLMLPFTLILGGLVSAGDIEPSISDYYHTILRDIFVGIMMAIGIFLICYTGYRRAGHERVSDDWVTTMAGVFALGVALFPNEVPARGQMVDAVPQLVLGIQVTAYLHYGSALLFLSCLAYISLFKFARSANPTRRRIYLTCGVVIVLSLIATVAASYFRVLGSDAARAVVNDYRLVLWFEAIGIWAFSVSWLTKGRVDHSIITALQGRTGA